MQPSTSPSTGLHRIRSSLAVLASAGLLTVACGPGEETVGDEADEAIDPDLDVEPEEGPVNDDDWEEPAEPESQAGDDLAAADGVLMAIEPACAEIGDGFTVNADGLEPDTDHVLMIDPQPSATSAFEAGVLATSDDDGALEASATLGEDAEIEPGGYQIELYTAAEGETDEWLISTDLEIAEDCAL